MVEDNDYDERLKMNTKLFEWPAGLNQSNLPSEVDWNTMGAVSPVKDQVSNDTCVMHNTTLNQRVSVADVLHHTKIIVKTCNT